MRSNVRICDLSGIDLASHHKRSAPDPKSFLLITFKKYCKCLLRNVSHHPLALIQFCRVRFEFSHGCMIWLPGFGKSWIAQLDATDIRELRGMRCVCQEHNRRPTGFHSKSKPQQFEFWSPRFEGDWNRRLPSLTRSRLPLPKRFYRRLVEVRISCRRDDLDVRNISLRIERQSETACPRLSRQRLAGRKRRRRRIEQSRLRRRLRCRARLGRLRPACLSIGRDSRQDRVQGSDRTSNGFFSSRRDDANNVPIFIYDRRPDGTRGSCPRDFQSIGRLPGDCCFASRTLVSSQRAADDCDPCACRKLAGFV